MGLPSKIKTDNGPAYISYKFKQFCQQYHIVHITGIEYNPQGQAFVEREHHTLKQQIIKLKRKKRDDLTQSEQSLQTNPRAILAQALFVIKFFNLPQGEVLSRADRHVIDLPPESMEQPVWIKIALDAE